MENFEVYLRKLEKNRFRRYSGRTNRDRSGLEELIAELILFPLSSIHQSWGQ